MIEICGVMQSEKVAERADESGRMESHSKGKIK